MDINEITKKALEDAFKKDVAMLFSNFITNVATAEQDQNEVAKAEENFSNGFHRSKKIFQRAKEIAVF
ncbi:hypothetical protein ACFL43_02340 [Thermodesulfobacteriota bacterium]